MRWAAMMPLRGGTGTLARLPECARPAHPAAAYGAGSRGERVVVVSLPGVCLPADAEVAVIDYPVPVFLLIGRPEHLFKQHGGRCAGRIRQLRVGAGLHQQRVNVRHPGRNDLVQGRGVALASASAQWAGAGAPTRFAT